MKPSPEDIPEDIWEALPRPSVTYADHSYPAYSREQMARALLAERLKERERLAKFGDALAASHPTQPSYEAKVAYRQALRDYATAIENGEP